MPSRPSHTTVTNNRKHASYFAGYSRPHSSRTHRILLRTSSAEIVQRNWNPPLNASPFGYVTPRDAFNREPRARQQARQRGSLKRARGPRGFSTGDCQSKSPVLCNTFDETSAAVRAAARKRIRQTDRQANCFLCWIWPISVRFWRSVCTPFR
jgi:hypothetical protein